MSYQNFKLPPEIMPENAESLHIDFTAFFIDC